MIIPITDRVKVIRPEAKSAYPYSNSLFIEDEITTLIDAGAGGRAYAAINPDKVQRLIFSHIHFDHTHGVGLFNNAALTVGQEEAEAYRDRRVYEEIVGINLWSKLMGGPRDDSLARAAAARDDVIIPEFTDFKVKEHIWEGRTIECGQVKLQALHAPGHSPGHYAFFLEDINLLFSGDLDLAPGGPWYGGAACDVELLEKSILRLMEINPAILVTSHRRVFRRKDDDIPALFKTYLEVVLQREERVLSYTSQPRNLEDMVKMEFDRYGYPGNPFPIFWTKVMFIKHLAYLRKKGLVKEVEEGIWEQA